MSTLTILDYDDTLLCSTYLQHTTVSKEILGELAVKVSALLETALERGVVAIVTNGENGWVELSSAKYIPTVVPLLDKIRVISARTLYERLYPNSPMKWKYCAFRDLLNEFHPLNVLSYGDSTAEREAVRLLGRERVEIKTKSVKFALRPNPEQLLRQIELVISTFKYVCDHCDNLDLHLTCVTLQ